MIKYFKAEDVLAIFSEEERPLNWTDTESEIQAVNDFDCYKRMIESLPTIEISEDCISRDMVAKRLAELWETEHPEKSYDEWLEIANKWCDYFPPSVVPTTEQYSKVGEWLQGNPLVRPICSVCGEPCIGLHGFDYKASDFCPNCGAKMKG